MVRHVVGNLIAHYPYVEIQGCDIGQRILKEFNRDFKSYSQNVVKKQGQAADDIVEALTSLAFRTTLNIVSIKKFGDSIELDIERHAGENKDYKLKLEDTLVTFEQELYLLKNGTQYDLLYREDTFYEKCPFMKSITMCEEEHTGFDLEEGFLYEEEEERPTKMMEIHSQL